VSWWQILTLFFPTVLVAVLIFFVAWLVATNAKWREVFDFLMGIVWGH
jgi:phage shock protein PspC (stress-responsive transcriptional regulator)